MAATAENTEVYDFPGKLRPLAEHRRYKVIHGGRGSGKSWNVARALILMAAERPMRVLCAREVQRSIKDSVHRLIADQIKKMGFGDQYDILAQEIRNTLTGSEFLFAGLGSATIESLKSFEGVDICWVEEGQVIKSRSLDILTPTIRKAGSEIWITLNPELDTDPVWVRYVENPPDNATVIELNWRDNPFFTDELETERQDSLRMVHKTLRTEDEHANIWEGQCRAAVAGAIYAKEMTAAKAEGRVGVVPYDPMLPVHRVWDLGWNDKMAILMVQHVASDMRVIDYLEDSHRTIDDYFISQEGREDLSSRPYRWGRDILPHDGKAKHFTSGKSAQQILEALGCDVECLDPTGVEDGIKVARMLLKRTRFDRSKAGDLVNRLARYKRRINATTDEPGTPLHDENSHGSDGFRYLALAEGLLQNDDSDGSEAADDLYAAFSRRAAGGF